MVAVEGCVCVCVNVRGRKSVCENVKIYLQKFDLLFLMYLQEGSRRDILYVGVSQAIKQVASVLISLIRFGEFLVRLHLLLFTVEPWLKCKKHRDVRHHPTVTTSQ